MSVTFIEMHLIIAFFLHVLFARCLRWLSEQFCVIFCNFFFVHFVIYQVTTLIGDKRLFLPYLPSWLIFFFLFFDYET